VKLVIMDIDDTLWRGVAAESAEGTPHSVEGWPLGVIEALSFLKRRGVLLALVSKNEEAFIEKLWRTIIGDYRLSLSDFVSRKINWRTKAENIAEILGEVNLLPRSVLFIDDNPVERAAVQAAFPDIRTFGPNPYVWRRLLLWAPEVQVATITGESAARTEMVRMQIAREVQRATLSRDEFLCGLGLTVRISLIKRTDQEGFKRSLELINKTNQFNTTGRRWLHAEFVELFARGGLMLVCSVSDRFTAYGVVGVLVLDMDRIEQFVMSCRVIGLDVEIAIVAEALSILSHRGSTSIQAKFTTTDANLLCRELWQQCGFEWTGGAWWRSLAQPLTLPPHVSLIREEIC
jgi:FkbH-like protein